MSANRLGDWLRNHSELQSLQRNLEQLASLNAIVAEALPGNLIVRAASLRTGELVLYADNGATAAKVKQLTPRVTAALRQRGYEITGIRIHVQVRKADNPLPEKQISLGSGARDAINALAGKLAPSALKTSLIRLLQR